MPIVYTEHVDHTGGRMAANLSLATNYQLKDSMTSQPIASQPNRGAMMLPSNTNHTASMGALSTNQNQMCNASDATWDNCHKGMGMCMNSIAKHQSVTMTTITQSQSEIGMGPTHIGNMISTQRGDISNINNINMKMGMNQPGLGINSISQPYYSNGQGQPSLATDNMVAMVTPNHMPGLQMSFHHNSPSNLPNQVIANPIGGSMHTPNKAISSTSNMTYMQPMAIGFNQFPSNTSGNGGNRNMNNMVMMMNMNGTSQSHSCNQGRPIVAMMGANQNSQNNTGTNNIIDKVSTTTNHMAVSMTGTPMGTHGIVAGGPWTTNANHIMSSRQGNNTAAPIVNCVAPPALRTYPSPVPPYTLPTYTFTPTPARVAAMVMAEKAYLAKKAQLLGSPSCMRKPRHRRSLKELVRNIWCKHDACGRVYATDSSLQNHLRIKHNNQRWPADRDIDDDIPTPNNINLNNFNMENSPIIYTNRHEGKYLIESAISNKSRTSPRGPNSSQYNNNMTSLCELINMEIAANEFSEFSAKPPDQFPEKLLNLDLDSMLFLQESPINPKAEFKKGDNAEQQPTSTREIDIDATLCRNVFTNNNNMAGSRYEDIDFGLGEILTNSRLDIGNRLTTAEKNQRIFADFSPTRIEELCKSDLSPSNHGNHPSSEHDNTNKIPLLASPGLDNHMISDQPYINTTPSTTQSIGQLSPLLLCQTEGATTPELNLSESVSVSTVLNNLTNLSRPGSSGTATVSSSQWDNFFSDDAVKGMCIDQGYLDHRTLTNNMASNHLDLSLIGNDWSEYLSTVLL